jgi:hypothetical protein
MKVLIKPGDKILYSPYKDHPSCVAKVLSVLIDENNEAASIINGVYYSASANRIVPFSHLASNQDANIIIDDAMVSAVIEDTLGDMDRNIGAYKVNYDQMLDIKKRFEAYFTSDQGEIPLDTKATKVAMNLTSKNALNPILQAMWEQPDIKPEPPSFNTEEDPLAGPSYPLDTEEDPLGAPSHPLDMMSPPIVGVSEADIQHTEP